MAKILRSAVPALYIRGNAPSVGPGSVAVYGCCGGGCCIVIPAGGVPCRVGHAVIPSGRGFRPQTGDAVHLVGAGLVTNGGDDQAHVRPFDSDGWKRCEVELNNGPRGAAGSASCSDIEARGCAEIRGAAGRVEQSVAPAGL